MVVYFVSVVFLPFILVGLWVIFAALVEARRGFQTRFWPRTIGKITRSETKKEGTGECETISPDIEYCYTLHGSTFHGKIIRRGLPSPMWMEFAEYFTSRYAVGQEVTLAYDPNDPKTSVLEPGLYKHAFAPIAKGLGCAVTAALFWLLVWTLDS